MKKLLAITSAIVIVFLLGITGSRISAMTRTSNYQIDLTSQGPNEHTTPDRLLQVLYDQTDFPGAGAGTSQEFEPQYFCFNNQGADDFVIPVGSEPWSIAMVFVDGIYYNGFGPAIFANVEFWSDANGLPGSLIKSYDGISILNEIGGDFTIDFSADPTVLTSGKYWISVAADMDFDPYGQWGWTERTVQSNNASAWQNPGNGFETGCTSWATRTSCAVGADPDLIFQLQGTIGAANANPFDGLSLEIISGDNQPDQKQFPGLAGCSEIFSVSGNVKDNDGNPITGATVSTNTGESGVTDLDGNYIISGLFGGSYSITPSKTGYSFSPTSAFVEIPPNAIDVDFVGTLNTGGEPVVLLVHGFQGLTSNPMDCNPSGSGTEAYHFSDPGGITPGQQYAVNYWADMPGWLDANYDVWIAQYKTKLSSTPSIYWNGQCLNKQIEYVSTHTAGQPIHIIAHSMGGLVSRACLNDSACRGRVDRLITLGSPHAGLPAAGIPLLLGGIPCVVQFGVCMMIAESMVGFNTITPNRSGIQYSFIGGDGTSGDDHPQQIVWEVLGAGVNEGLVGKYSSVGWVFPFELFVPIWWVDNSWPQQFWTDEFHSTAYIYDNGNQIRNDYFHDRFENPSLKSHAYECIAAILQGNYPDDDFCKIPSQNELATAQTKVATQLSKILSGNLNSGQSISLPLQIDTNNQTIFTLSWHTGTLDFTLERPDGQLIDPVYAANNPDEVAYSLGSGGGDALPAATYVFTNTMSGEWSLLVDATNLGAPTTNFLTFAAMQANRTLSAGTDKYYYAPNETAVLTATLEINGSGLTGMSVSAEIKRTDGGTDSLSLSDQGGGNYLSGYLVPNAPGYLEITITAEGNDNGVDFTRQTDLLAVVMAQDAQFAGDYDDQPEDEDGDGLYEVLNFTLDVNVFNAGDYLVSALLVSNTGQRISSASVGASLSSGSATLTLPFNGDEIRSAQINGPYIVTDLQIIEIISGVPSQIANNIYTTPAYAWNQFGSGAGEFEILLPIIRRD